jgi:glycosyltransferase involved in cell wall biosynthesis
MHHLRALSRAKVVVCWPHGPGAEAALVEAMAVGACIVTAGPLSRVPAPLTSGEQLLVVRDDGADLVDACAQLLGDATRRRRLGARARAYFDRYLHPASLREQLRDPLPAKTRLANEGGGR